MKYFALLITLWLCTSAAEATVLYRFSFSNTDGNVDATVSGILAVNFPASSPDQGDGTASVTDITYPPDRVLPPGAGLGADMEAWMKSSFGRVRKSLDTDFFLDYRVGAGVEVDGPLLCMNNGARFQLPDQLQFACESGMNFFGTRSLHISNSDGIAGVTFTRVPEPAGAALLVTAWALLVSMGRRRRPVGANSFAHAKAR